MKPNWKKSAAALMALSVVVAACGDDEEEGGGDATATVVYHFQKTPDDKVSTPMTFVKENGDWKVCSPGPR